MPKKNKTSPTDGEVAEPSAKKSIIQEDDWIQKLAQESKLYKCYAKVCSGSNRMFSTHEEREKHYRDVHWHPKEPTNICRRCSKSYHGYGIPYKSQEELIQHVKEKHQGNVDDAIEIFPFFVDREEDEEDEEKDRWKKLNYHLK